MKSLILIFIALGCGLVASIGISQVMNRDSGGGGSLEVEQILVALTDIDIGTKLTAQNVKLEDWPKAKVPEGAVIKLEDVKDKFSNARFYKGEPIHVTKISDSLGNIASKVPPGYRAMPVKVDEDTVMKAISPGDRVDVLVFLRRDDREITQTGAFPILKNCRVFAVNTNTERAVDAKGETSNFRTVSLLVKEDHTGELAVAAQMGKILLTLRRPDEEDNDLDEEVTPIKEILSGKARSQSDPVASPQQPVAAPPQNFLDFAKGAGEDNAAAPAAEAFWKMDILGPADRKRFEWADEKSLPVESTLPGGGAAGTTAAAPVEPKSTAEPDSARPPVGGPSDSNKPSNRRPGVR
jgi:pilus assembly protein CpaB